MQDVLSRAGNPWRVPKVKQIFDQLGALASRQKATAQQTVSDDAEVSADRQADIERQESLVRKALGLFGINYDDLIAMDGKSSYSQAVAAQPEIARQVVNDEAPVLAALRVAVDYQPYAEFAAKYGTSPEEIRQNMQKEMQQAAPADVEPAPRGPVGPVFSAYAGGARAPASKRGGRSKVDLASVFGR